MLAHRTLPVLLAFAVGCGAASAPAVAEQAPAPAPGVAAAIDSAAAAAAPISAGQVTSLAPTSEVPWNPAKPVPDAEGWETAVRLPGRILSLPLSGLGYVMRAGLLHVEQDYLVPKSLYLFAAPGGIGLGFFPSSLGDRTGLGGAVNFSPRIFHHWVLAEWSGSTSRYTRTRLQIGDVRHGIEYLSEWRPEERFYGVGPAASQFDTSRYAAHFEAYTVRARFAIGPQQSPLRDRSNVDVWTGVRRITTSRGRGDRDSPSLEQRFPQLATDFDHPASHVASGARLSADWRFGSPHWTRGGRASLAYQRWDALHQSFIFGATPEAITFSRWILDAEGGFSFMRDPRTIRLSVHSDHTDADEPPPGASLPAGFSIGDLLSLGAHPGLEGYEPGRWHDLDDLVGRITYIFPLAQHYEMDFHIEQGTVSHDIFEDPRLDKLQTSFGLQLRPRTDRAPLGSIGVEWGRERVRFRYSWGGVE